MTGMLAQDTKLTPEAKQRLDLLRAGFNAFVVKTVTTPFEEGLAKLAEKVIPALQRASSAAAANKDLETLVRIKNDLERLGKGQALTAADVPLPPPAITAVYTAYKAEYSKLQAVREAAFADARQRYDRGLSTLQDELTAQQNVDAAVYVKQLRAELASTGVDLAEHRTTTSPAASGMPTPREWTYHSKENIGSIATMAFFPDGTFIMPWKNLNSPHRGTWKATQQPGVFKLVYTNVGEVGQTPFELKITGDKGEMNVPNVGMRYLRAKPGDDSSKIAGLWTCHVSQDGAPTGLLTLHPDSRLMLKMDQVKGVWTGSWNDADRPGNIRINFESHPQAGTTPFEVSFTGDAAEMEMPNGAGKLFLRFKCSTPTVVVRKEPPSVPKVAGIPSEWTYHSRADWYSIAWLRLLPSGAIEWHDRKGVQMLKWRRTADGFEVDYPNEKTWVVKLKNGSADVDRAPAGPSNDFLFLKTPLEEESDG